MATTSKASLTNYRQSPRKTRTVSDLVRGKSVAEAMTLLEFTTKRASDPLIKLIASAVSNAKNAGLSVEKLIIKEIRVDKGIVNRRYKPGFRGGANPILHRLSHVTVVLTTNDQQPTTGNKKRNQRPTTNNKNTKSPASVVGRRSSVVG